MERRFWPAFAASEQGAYPATELATRAVASPAAESTLAIASDFGQF